MRVFPCQRVADLLARRQPEHGNAHDHAGGRPSPPPLQAQVHKRARQRMPGATAQHKHVSARTPTCTRTEVHPSPSACTTHSTDTHQPTSTRGYATPRKPAQARTHERAIPPRSASSEPDPAPSQPSELAPRPRPRLYAIGGRSRAQSYPVTRIRFKAWIGNRLHLQPWPHFPSVPCLRPRFLVAGCAHERDCGATGATSRP